MNPQTAPDLYRKRTYNSAPSSTKIDRGLGHGWVHSYLMRLKSNDFGDCPTPRRQTSCRLECFN